MPRHLRVTLQLRWIKNDEYAAKVTTEASDSCYKPKSIRHGLPPGMVGIPEIAYLTAELEHEEGKACGDIVFPITQEIDNISSAGHPLGVTVFVLVNGEIAGTAHQQFPRIEAHQNLMLAVEKLKSVAASSTDSCLTAKAIAASDSGVQEHFLAHIERGNVFRGVRCIEGSSGPERRVLFEFDCAPSEFCFIRPSFLAVIDLTARRVSHIADPYVVNLSGEVEHVPVLPSAPFTLATPSEAQGVAATPEAMAPFQAREEAFFAARGIPYEGASLPLGSSMTSATSPIGTVETYMTSANTAVGSTTISHGRSDDSQVDYHADNHVDNRMKTDVYDDRHVDD